MFHPWRALRALSHVVVVWARPHAAAPAAMNGVDIVWLDPRMSQVERRCVLTHELVRLEHGHRGCQPAAVEHAVRAITARRLITHEQLVVALPWAMSLDEFADELWVTPSCSPTGSADSTGPSATTSPPGSPSTARPPNGSTPARTVQA